MAWTQEKKRRSRLLRGITRLLMSRTSPLDFVRSIILARHVRLPSRRLLERKIIRITGKGGYDECTVRNCWRTYRKDVLGSIVPGPRHHFARMTFVLLYRRIGNQTHVVVGVEVEQRARFPSCFLRVSRAGGS
jgi:hypothetical protein